MLFNPVSLLDKRYLITGAASGLGKATSILLSKLGAELILVDIDEEGLNDTSKMCSSNVIKVIINLYDISDLKAKIIDSVSKFGKLNGFVHLAGRPYISPLKSINEKTTTEVFMLNTYVGIELAKICTNRKIFAGESGSLVFISSVYGLVGSAANVGYAMSKSALHGVTKSLAIELAPKNIRVNCIAPGFIKTNMLQKISDSFNSEYNDTLTKLHPLGLGEADDVANSVAFLLSDMSKWITGSIMSVDGGFTAQ
ncbi:MAG: SDR family oxidoreductase [Gelidibacter sp.]|nr:SDR family oxidoreductase [Gelidibacter sp.]